MMDLRQALRVGRGTRLAVVGAGGKTTALFQLARCFDPPVVVTTSTHMGEWQCGMADRHFIITGPEDLDGYSDQIEGVTLFTGLSLGDQRLDGLGTRSLARLKTLGDERGFPILIEADGSRQRPLKAPAIHEPVIPEWVNHVVVVVGLSGLGHPLSDQTVHRPELFSRLSGVGPGGIIDEDGLARVLVHPQGGIKNVPEGVRRILLLNQVDDEKIYESALRIANIVNQTYKTQIITNLKNQTIHSVIEPTAGIILASGASKRFGQPKILLPWRGKPLVRWVIESAVAAGLQMVVVVVGPTGDQVRAASKGLDVKIVDNPEWQRGQSTSIRKGLLSLPHDCGAAIFLLADQPTVTGEVVTALIQLHQQTLAKVIAPRVEGIRTNPVLFDRETFPDLSQIEGDIGGRAIFDRYPITYLDWEDENLLVDIDTHEDYHKLQGIG